VPCPAAKTTAVVVIEGSFIEDKKVTSPALPFGWRNARLYTE
jgi:hypothetical protein